MSDQGVDAHRAVHSAALRHDPGFRTMNQWYKKLKPKKAGNKQRIQAPDVWKNVVSRIAWRAVRVIRYHHRQVRVHGQRRQARHRTIRSRSAFRNRNEEGGSGDGSCTGPLQEARRHMH